MTREERISAYEETLDRALQVADQTETALRDCERILPDLQALDEYYASPVWKEDYAADEAGLIPKDLKRGVLSQDAVYDLLERFRELRAEMSRIAGEWQADSISGLNDSQKQ